VTPVRLVIVGGGPRCTYALERLAAETPSIALPPGGLHISVFERNGRFGAGAAHSDRQPETSYLNRVASQLSFAADESNADARRLLPREYRPTFVEWCQARYKLTGDERFNVHPLEVPRRYLHGVALAEMFGHFVDLLRAVDGVRVEVYAAQVEDIEPVTGVGGAFRVYTSAGTLEADHVLLVTGQSENRPAPGSDADLLARHAGQFTGTGYVACPYPLRERVTAENVPGGSRVGVLGLGLTAVDLILHLTEGRGGTFETNDDDSLRYRPSGREPGRIVAVSPSGSFPWTRPDNHKAADGSGISHAALEHRPAFLTLAAVAALRRRSGRPATFAAGTVRQLDFDRHIFPLVVLEMAYVYYKTLFGSSVAGALCAAVQRRYQVFLASGHGDRNAAVSFLLDPLDGWFEEVAEYIEASLAGAPIPDRLLHFRATPVLQDFLRTVHSDRRETDGPPWGHALDVRAHRFDWHALFDPLAADTAADDDWHDRAIAHMRRDQAAARQGNLANPVKAACDGVWRDLRGIFSAVLDFGGLTARSHRAFLEVHLRHYTRMSNGTGLEPMRKILALAEHGVLDLSIGPDPAVEPQPGRPGFVLRGSRTGAQAVVDVIVEGRGQPFDPLLDVVPLYRNLIQRGVVRQWRNPAADEADFLPGPLDLDRQFHPLRADGTAEERIAILGTPAEGMVFFQLSAGRPYANSAVINNVARWANQFLDSIVASN
jgi:hypothetical protein